jgi:serine/threonine protein kinase
LTVPGVLTEVWEWAAYGLDDWLRRDDREPGSSIVDEVAANVTRALEVLHRLGAVHCDVAPSNILFVDGTWKLGDLDSCVRFGEPASRGPMAERKRYQHPDRRVGPAPARHEFDWWGLAQVLSKLRES